MRSDAVRKGMQQAPHRSLFNALGMTKEEMERPLVGIVSSYNEIVPGHMNLDKITEAVKLGVAMAGGTPVVFPAIAVCDGIAMGHIGMKYSLVTRDLIADSTEAMAMAHQFDALVMIPNCDKNVPGLLMAAARINVPTVFVSGGPMMAGHVKGQKDVYKRQGYGVYDLYDLGEFDQKGTVPTKYGTRDEYLRAVRACHDAGLEVYADIVLNHRMGADEAETVRADAVNSANRNQDISPNEEIQAWTKFTFPGRHGKYSDFVWNWSCFDGVDWEMCIRDRYGIL